MTKIETIYLSGGIFGLTDEQCRGWRDEATRRLGDRFNILDPMRRDYRGKELTQAEELVRNDEADIENSTIMLVNACTPSWGTAMEVYYASHLRYQPDIVAFNVSEPISPWVYQHTSGMFADLEMAIQYILERY